MAGNVFYFYLWCKISNFVFVFANDVHKVCSIDTIKLFVFVWITDRFFLKICGNNFSKRLLNIIYCSFNQCVCNNTFFGHNFIVILWKTNAIWRVVSGKVILRKIEYPCFIFGSDTQNNYLNVTNFYWKYKQYVYLFLLLTSSGSNTNDTSNFS